MRPRWGYLLVDTYRSLPTFDPDGVKYWQAYIATNPHPTLMGSHMGRHISQPTHTRPRWGRIWVAVYIPL